MTYNELMKKIQREIANDTFRSYFAFTTETVDLTYTNKKTFMFINPWYNTPAGGMEEAFFHISPTEADYVILLIKESSGAGAGKAGEFQREILKKARLLASIKMPSALMVGMGASVQTAIYIFDTRYKHKEESLVTFIDFSVDGYDRKKNKNSAPLIKDIDHADERYMELLAHILGKKPKTKYYTEENGLLIKEPITLDGEDWTFSQHKHIDTTITEDDLKATLAEYLTWQIQLSLKGKKNMKCINRNSTNFI